MLLSIVLTFGTRRSSQPPAPSAILRCAISYRSCSQMRRFTATAPALARRVEIVADDRLRAEDDLVGQERGQRHPRARAGARTAVGARVAAAHPQPLDHVRVAAEARVGLHAHLIGAAELVEVVD